MTDMMNEGRQALPPTLRELPGAERPFPRGARVAAARERLLGRAEGAEARARVGARELRVARQGLRKGAGPLREGRITPAYFSEELARKIHGSKLVLMPQGGHCASETMLEAFNEELFEFLG